MLVGAGDHIGGTADQRLQRFRAAAEIGDGDVKPLFLEVAEPLGQRQRQIIQRALAADAEHEIRLFDLVLGLGGCAAQDQRCDDPGGEFDGFHGRWSPCIQFHWLAY